MSIQRLFRILALATCLLGSGMVQAVPPLAVDRHYDVPFNAPADLFLAGVNPNSDGSDPRVYFEPVTPPMHGNVVFGTLNGVIYTPHKGYSGPDSFTFRVSHPVHGYSNVATASLTVAAAAPPVAHPGSGYVPRGTVTPFTLAGTDPNPGGPFALTYAVHAQPAHGSVTIAGSTATYTPADDGHWGEDSFSFTVASDNGSSAPAAVRVLVGQRVTLGVAGMLGDTGQTQCTDSAGAATACAALTSHPGQDGRFGRDAQLGAEGCARVRLPAAGRRLRARPRDRPHLVCRHPARAKLGRCHRQRRRCQPLRHSHRLAAAHAARADDHRAPRREQPGHRRQRLPRHAQRPALEQRRRRLHRLDG